MVHARHRNVPTPTDSYAQQTVPLCLTIAQVIPVSTVVLFSVNNLKHSPLSHVSKLLDCCLIIQIPTHNQ
jgi:hypothetical protein